MAWHAKCYKPRIGDNFPVAKLSNYEEDEGEIKDEREVNKFNFARKGDNYMCPFQCDLCHFRNVMRRNPGIEPDFDKKLMVYIRRAILDSFWARAESTVEGNTRELKKLWRHGNEELLIPNLLPEMGPFPLDDLWGMRVAIVTLRRSLDKGVYKETVQYDTTRRIRSSFSNCWGASINTMLEGVMAKERSKIYVTKCPTYALWFERFNKGLHSRMGDDRRPDMAICSELMKEIMSIVNADYVDAESDLRKRYLARAGLFFIGGYFGSLRGEEVNRVLRKYFISLNKESLKMKKTPHAVLPLFGNFKGEHGIPRCYLRRIVSQSKSGLNAETWINRVIEFEQHSNTMYLFAGYDGKKEAGRMYETYLFDVLEEIQERSDGLISKAVNVREVYGISRSFRRGSTTEDTNADKKDCNEVDIERNNRWRKDDAAGTKEADLSMIHVYNDTYQAINAELRFSRCL